MESVPPPDHPVRQGAGTLAENLIEYAGRVCYRSEARMGTQPAFISLRVREGHEDIIEHVRFVFRVEQQPLDEDVLLLANQPSVEYTRLAGEQWIFSLNARNIRDFWRQSHSPLARALVALAQPVLPTVYADIERQEEAGS
ncbi:MAG: FAD-dependent thymidylate synthase [Chloroflexi bacterium]|nr:FAD-dependent thymidylate synthase [Chloroflexota bacterium]